MFRNDDVLGESSLEQLGNISHNSRVIQVLLMEYSMEYDENSELFLCQTKSAPGRNVVWNNSLKLLNCGFPIDIGINI